MVSLDHLLPQETRTKLVASLVLNLLRERFQLELILVANRAQMTDQHPDGLSYIDRMETLNGGLDAVCTGYPTEIAEILMAAEIRADDTD